VTALGDSFKDLLSCKWNLWHGNVEESLSKLEMLMLNISDAKRSRLKGLYEYLNQNQDYIVNYEERKGLGKTFTTQVTESHIESIINVRHKRVERCNGVGRAQRSSNPQKSSNNLDRTVATGSAFCSRSGV